MAEHLNALVVVVLAAILLLLLLGVSGIIGGIAKSSGDTSCPTSVAERVQALFVTDNAEPLLTGCDTRTATFTKDTSDAAIASRIATDYSWCANSFKPAWTHPITRKSSVYCHVCAYYTYSGSPRAVPGVLTALLDNGIASDGINITGVSSPDILKKQPMLLEKNLSIVFYQERQDSSVLGQYYKKWQGGAAGGLLGYGGVELVAVVLPAIGSLPVTATVAAVGAAGGYLFGGYLFDGNTVHSDIIIRPLDSDMVNGLGCTTTDVRQP